VVDLKERQELGWLLGATAGRVLGAPYALLIGQEQAGKMLAGSRKEDHEDVVRRMEEQYPEELANTAVRLGGPHTWDDIKRIWHNPRVGLLMRLIGTAATPIHNLAGALARSSYYNPFSDTATVYGNVPAITAGVLGRAADFNRRRFEAPIFDRAARSAYHAAGSLVDGHPVGLLQAMRGASRATQAAGDDEQRAEMRRWLWPSVAISAVPGWLGQCSCRSRRRPSLPLSLMQRETSCGVRACLRRAQTAWHRCWRCWARWALRLWLAGVLAMSLVEWKSGGARTIEVESRKMRSSHEDSWCRATALL